MEKIDIYNKFLIYKKNTYQNVFDIDLKKRNLKLTLYDRNIVIRKYSDIKSKSDSIKLLNTTILEDLPVQDNILLHHEFDKKERSLYVYSINGSQVINELSKDANKLKVEPIQFRLINKFNKKYKGIKEYSLLVYIKQKYYFIKVKNKFIIFSYLGEKLDNILQYLQNSKRLYVDKSISSKKFECVDYIKYINLKELSDDRLFG